jgi:hypothetical protein
MEVVSIFPWMVFSSAVCEFEMNMVGDGNWACQSLLAFSLIMPYLP